MRRTWIALGLLLPALALSACGSDDSDSAADKPSTAKAKPKPKGLVDYEEAQLAFVNKALAQYCVERIGYLIDKRPNPPSDKTLEGRDRALDRLTELIRKKPTAKSQITGQTVSDTAIERIEGLERGCDKAAAKRLELTLESSR